jgi:hypothetical protein
MRPARSWTFACTSGQSTTDASITTPILLRVKQAVSYALSFRLLMIRVRAAKTAASGVGMELTESRSAPLLT